ncbi:MAG: hypothetical protein KGJ13_08955 [Patescibacteria group bacterium]|nr:hypothetical protein [Patescibacteria group bacterium]
MKENTVFHFGTAERKYSCFEKFVSNGSRPAPCAADKKSKKKPRLFLRQTNAGEMKSTVRRVPTTVLVQWRDGFDDLAEAMAWADRLMAEGERTFKVKFSPRPSEAHQ